MSLRLKKKQSTSTPKAWKRAWATAHTNGLIREVMLAMYPLVSNLSHHDKSKQKRAEKAFEIIADLMHPEYKRHYFPKI